MFRKLSQPTVFLASSSSLSAGAGASNAAAHADARAAVDDTETVFRRVRVVSMSCFTLAIIACRCPYLSLMICVSSS